MRLSREVIDALVAANTGIAVSETGVIAHAVKVVFCSCCDACRPVDRDCRPLPPVEDTSVAVLDRIRALAGVASRTESGGH